MLLTVGMQWVSPALWALLFHPSNGRLGFWGAPTETISQDGKWETFTAALHICTKEVVSGSGVVFKVDFLGKDYVSGPVYQCIHAN